MRMPPYVKRLRAILSPAETRTLARLSTPQKVQDYLDSLPINFFDDVVGDFFSVRRVLKEKKAHCIEGAVFAAASLAYHGELPLLMDFQTLDCDEDHVVALFKSHGLWGAVSKTNHAILRWRDPVYKTIRELAMSYFHEYYMHDGRKTLCAYSRPFDLRRYPPERWITAESGLDGIAEDLDASPHYPIISKSTLSKLRRASKLERVLLDSVEWKHPGK